MPEADGSIWIKIKADDEQAHKQLAKLNKDIEKTEKQIESLGEKKMPLVEQAKELGAQLDAAKAKLETMQSGKEFWPKASVKAQQAEVNGLQKQWDNVNNKLDDVNGKIQKATNSLAKQKEEAGEVQEKIAGVSDATRAMANAGLAAEQSMKRFSKRVQGLFKRILVFSLITVALRSMRDWMSKVIKTNQEATGAMARLKGAMLTLAQPLVDFIVPAFTALVNVLTAVVGQVASLVSSLFGSTASASAEAAEALYEETEALEGTGSAAKKAGKSLAFFDEINKLSNNEDTSGGGTSTETIAPDFSWADSMSEKLNQIANAVLLIAAGFALWKIGTMLPGVLGTIATKLGGILLFIGGLILAWNGLKDAWENGVDWSNIAAIIAGVAAAAAGLWLVFGNVGAGIALIVGGIAMLVTGFKDVIENGANLKNTLLIITGIISAGLGIALVAHSWIPLLIAGIVAIVAAIVAWQGNMEDLAIALKHIFNGIVDFFVGVFTGDTERALKGLQNIFRGAINAIIVVFESLVNAIIGGLNWLISKANSLAKTVGIGSFIPEIPKVALPRVPYLAQGAVIPPNREFLAVLGDQTSGNNIETPEALLRKIVREESGSGTSDSILRDILDAIREGQVITVDNTAFGKVVRKASANTARAAGTSTL